MENHLEGLKYLQGKYEFSQSSRVSGTHAMRQYHYGSKLTRCTLACHVVVRFSDIKREMGLILVMQGTLGGGHIDDIKSY